MAFKEDVQININRLDRDTISQVTMYEEWSHKWADAINERDHLKESLSVIRAQTDDLIRKNPKKYGWDSESKAPTEVWIANKIILHEAVITATEEYLTALHEVNIFAVAKETLEHRKKALEILTDLFKGNYFTARSRDDSDFKTAISEEGRTAQNEALNNNERLRKRRGT